MSVRPRDRYGRPLARDAPDEVVDSVRAAFERAVALFDQERFFEAHEFFEWIWKSEAVEAADRDFWKGVTQVAVGCVHTQRGNADGAIALLARAADHLAPYPSPHHGVDTAALVRAAHAVAAAVRSHGPSPSTDFPALPRAG